MYGINLNNVISWFYQVYLNFCDKVIFTRVLAYSHNQKKKKKLAWKMMYQYLINHRYLDIIIYLIKQLRLKW